MVTACRLSLGAVCSTVLTFAPGEIFAQQAPPRIRVVVATEYRPVPLHTRSVTHWPNRWQEVRSQETRLSGVAFGADLRMRACKGLLELVYGVRVRYDHLYLEPSGTIGSDRSVNALTSDHLISVRLNLPLNENLYVCLSGGGGLMNLGSNFDFSYRVTAWNGTQTVVHRTGTFRYFGLMCGAAIRYRRAEAGLVGYYNGSPNEFEFPSPYWLPSIHAGFRLTK